MDIVQDNGPVFGLDSAGVAFEPRGLARQGARAGLRAAVDVRTGIGRVMQQAQHAPLAQALPNNLAALVATPHATGKAEVLVLKLLHDGQRRAGLLKQVKYQADGMLHFLIRVKHHVVSGIVDQAHRQAHAELTPLGLLQFAAEETTAEPMKFGFAHRALKSQEQAIVILTGIVDTFFVDDECFRDGADLKQAIPVAARPSQARNFEAEHRPGVPQTDFDQERLKAIAASSGRSGVALILVDHRNVLRGPT